MKEITATRSEIIKVTINEREERSIVRSYILGMLSLDNRYDWLSIKEGSLIGTIDYGGHGSGYTEDKCIREATDLDKAAVLILKKVGYR